MFAHSHSRLMHHWTAALHLMYNTINRCHKDVSSKTVGYIRPKTGEKKGRRPVAVLTDFDMYDSDADSKEMV